MSNSSHKLAHNLAQLRKAIRHAQRLGNHGYAIQLQEQLDQIAPPKARRSAAQIAADRQALAADFDADWKRAPAAAAVSDLKALVAQGVLEREVRREWDRQPMASASASALFGGAGVVQRRRAYYRAANQQD